MSMTVSNVQSTLAAASNTASTTGTSTTEAADRFLKLLVAQMQNQDPLSPMDNAQVTSQMAQINTVTGIEKLNTTVQGLSTQFVQMQALQGAALVGREVVVPGNRIDMQSGVGQGGFELTSAADAVKVEVLSPAGQVVDTMNLGAQSAGMHSFDWTAGNNASAAGLTFRVTATSGSTKLDSTALMRDKVDAVSTSGDTLTLELQNSGSVAYSKVKAFN
jgi:flagellar basal-body rod modification protein FlgD